MGKSYTVTLSSDNPSPAVYLAGDTFTAQLVFDLNRKNFKFKEIRVRLLGKSKCEWGSGRSSNEGRETFCDIPVHVHGPPSTFENPDHPFHVCHLTCTLPSNLPSSYEASYGEIYYQVKLHIKGACSPWTPSKTFKFPIDRVIGRLHVLATSRCEPRRRPPPIWFSDSSKIWTPSLRNCGTGTGTVDWTIRMDGGSQYLWGDLLHFGVQVNNRSWKILDSISAHVVQIVTYNASGCCSGGTMVDERVMTSEIFDQGLQGPCTTSVVGNLGIMAGWPVTSIGGRCTTMEIEYGVRFKVKVGLFTVKKMLPIVIGNMATVDTLHRY